MSQRPSVYPAEPAKKVSRAASRKRQRERSITETDRGKSRSYVVPCSSAFRNSILELVGRRGVSAGEMARSVLLLIPHDPRKFPDPGEPGADDRESVTLKSGPNAGKVWRRKPRLQVRMQAGLTVADIRRALALALYMDRGDVAFYLSEGGVAAVPDKLGLAEVEIELLRKQIRALAFKPIPGGPKSRADALYILGFHPDMDPSPTEISRQYRNRAAIHHPDRTGGDDTRMRQINDAVRMLRRK